MFPEETRCSKSTSLSAPQRNTSVRNAAWRPNERARSDEVHHAAQAAVVGDDADHGEHGDDEAHDLRLVRVCELAPEGEGYIARRFERVQGGEDPSVCPEEAACGEDSREEREDRLTEDER